MIYGRALKASIAGASLLSLRSPALAQNAPAVAAKPFPFVSPIFGDNMVLQRGKANILWGWSDPGDKVRVEIAGKHASGVAAGGSHSLRTLVERGCRSFGIWFSKGCGC